MKGRGIKRAMILIDKSHEEEGWINAPGNNWNVTMGQAKM